MLHLRFLEVEEQFLEQGNNEEFTLELQFGIFIVGLVETSISYMFNVYIFVVIVYKPFFSSTKFYFLLCVIDIIGLF